MLKDFLFIFFPRLCDACNKPLVKGEEIICTHCLHDLPRTRSHIENLENLTAKFYGKLNISAVYSFLYFRKHGPVQQLLHRLKYQHKPEIGQFLGRLYGSEISETVNNQQFDLIIPVPLHKARQRRRGYNQSEHFSIGLSKILEIPVDSISLIRSFKSQTQTNKNRQERWDNVKDIFHVKNPERVKDKRILLTDDVMTTGATLEACAQKLYSAGASEITIATIAVAI